jgi:DNA-binding PadR family transcriptional regulator
LHGGRGSPPPGLDEFHGYLIAKEIKEHADNRLLTAYGTLYRALGRLETMGCGRAAGKMRWWPPRESSPGARFYSLTPAGEEAVAEAARAVADTRARKGWASA